MAVRLLVEGKDDLLLVTSLLSNHGIDPDEDFEISDCNGVQTLLRESLPATLEGSYDAVGVIVDADLDFAARWAAIRNRLLDKGYTPPHDPAPAGLILTNRPPAVGVWLMPDNVSPGTLEDFVQHLIPDDDVLWPIATKTVQALPPPRRFPDAMYRKAEIHTYLAWQERPGQPISLALRLAYFQANAPLASLFAGWVQRLRNVSA
jgi:hypothetical protein